METTTKKEVVSFDAIMSQINGEKPEETKPKDNFFTREEKSTKQTDFLTKIKDDGSVEDEDEVDEKGKDKQEKPEELAPEEQTTDFIVGKEKRDANEKTFQSGDIDKLYRELVKREVIVGFEDDKPVTTVEEIHELLEENRRIDRERILNEELPQFIGSLPEEVQVLVKYTAEGGKDLKSMFKVLADIEEFRQVEVTEDNTKGQEDVVYKYLKAVKFAKGNDAKIQEQIEEWKDNGTLYKKAKEFKVDLDEMQEQLVEQRLQEQEERAKSEKKREEKIKQEVYENIIKDSNLNGIKLDKQTQEKLFLGLTKKGWKTNSGEDVNLLGALVEYYTYHKPDYKLLGEALYLLMEPDNYRKKITSEVKREVNSDTMRKLKTEESRKLGGNVSEEKQGIKRRTNDNNFWKWK